MSTFAITTAVNKKRISRWGDVYHINMCVYRIICNSTGKIYVGQSIGKVGKRWNSHLSIKSGKGKSAIKLAIEKYGKDDFDFKVIDCANSIVELNEKEIFWIKELNTVSPIGYNLTEGGNKNPIFSEESKKRMRESAKIRFEREGRTITPESEEHREFRLCVWRQKSRERHIGNTYRKGTKCSKETIEKIRESKLGNSNHNTSVIRNDGVIYESVKAAALDIGAKANSISAVLLGIRNSVYGYTFNYLNKKGGLSSLLM